MAARDVIGIGKLRKDQLQYELSIRGLDDQGDISELGARLRAGLDRPVTASGERIGQVGVAFSSCSVALDEMGQVVQLLAEGPCSRNQLYRVQAQVTHWVNRVSDLKAVVSEGELKDKVELLVAGFNSIQEELKMLNSEKGPREVCLGAENTEGSARVHWQREESSVAGNDMFAKLPNPLLILLQRVTELDIDCEDSIINLLWFLVELERQSQNFQLSSRTILRAVLPLCKGSLIEIVSEVLNAGGGLTQLRLRILEQRLSPRVRHELVSKHVFRVQGDNELIANYIWDVRTAVTALCVQNREEEIVEAITQGINPRDRSCIMFASKPTTFADLEKLVTQVASVAQADIRRAQRGGKHPVTELRGEDYTSDRPRVARKCFRCNKVGHFARDCSKSGGHRAS